MHSLAASAITASKKPFVKPEIPAKLKPLFEEIKQARNVWLQTVSENFSGYGIEVTLAPYIIAGSKVTVVSKEVITEKAIYKDRHHKYRTKKFLSQYVTQLFESILKDNESNENLVKSSGVLYSARITLYTRENGSLEESFGTYTDEVVLSQFLESHELKVTLRD